MKDGVYLLIERDQPFGTPIVLRNHLNPDGSPFALLVGVSGITVLSNLEPGTTLIPMVALTEQRVAALKVVISYATKYADDHDEIIITQTMLDEMI
jgi:hypothetical protein